MKVLGYNGGLYGYPGEVFFQSHDAAAVLVVDGRVVAASEEERFSREKHSGKFPGDAVKYVLREGGVRAEDLDLVTYYYSYDQMFNDGSLRENVRGMNPVIRAGLRVGLPLLRWYNRVSGLVNDKNRGVFERNVGISLPKSKFVVVPHHVCHIASAFYTSNFDRALGFSIDGQGESAASRAMVVEGGKAEYLRETFTPNSFGFLYLAITSFLGFEPYSEYKIMGLAPYGDPSKYRSYFESIVDLHDDGTYQINSHLMGWLMIRDALFKSKDVPRGYPPSMTEALGPARSRSEPVTQRHMDIAAALQESVERGVLHTLRYLRQTTGEKNLAMAGGVALNCTMNGKIARSGIFDSIYIHPAAGDAGTALGAALWGSYNVLKEKWKPLPKFSAYLGLGCTGGDIDAAAIEYDKKVSHTRPADIFKYTAQAIADGKVVGWYQGRAEWGPRALGNRSILADPRRDDMKDIVNHAVKLREGFRPFAPSCLAEHAAEWFDMTGLVDKASPYMLFTVMVHKDKRALIPAVTHVDGSSRVQTVSESDNPRYHKLLKTFHEITGVPLLLNTSFNVKNEAIVNTPGDAIRCFLNTQIDLLVLGDVVIEKHPHVAAALAKERSSRSADAGRVIDGQIRL